MNKRLIDNLKNGDRIIILVGGAIIISLGLVALSLYIYNTSGAAQLDLSRPGYKSISKQVKSTDDSSKFSDKGSVDKSTIEQFKQLFDTEASKVRSSNSFSDDALSLKNLETK